MRALMIRLRVTPNQPLHPTLRASALSAGDRRRWAPIYGSFLHSIADLVPRQCQHTYEARME